MGVAQAPLLRRPVKLVELKGLLADAESEHRNVVLRKQHPPYLFVPPGARILESRRSALEVDAAPRQLVLSRAADLEAPRRCGRAAEARRASAVRGRALARRLEISGAPTPRAEQLRQLGRQPRQSTSYPSKPTRQSRDPSIGRPCDSRLMPEARARRREILDGVV